MFNKEDAKNCYYQTIKNHYNLNDNRDKSFYDLWSESIENHIQNVYNTYGTYCKSFNCYDDLILSLNGLNHISAIVFHAMSLNKSSQICIEKLQEIAQNPKNPNYYESAMIETFIKPDNFPILVTAIKEHTKAYQINNSTMQNPFLVDAQDTFNPQTATSSFKELQKI